MHPLRMLLTLLATFALAARGAGDPPPDAPASPASPASPAPPVSSAQVPTIEQAADALLAAVASKDDAALKGLALKDEPDPWLVVDELLRRDALAVAGAADAVDAFARAAPRPATQGLAAYVAARRGMPGAPARRERLARATEALQAGRFQEAASLLGAAEPGPIDDVVGIGLSSGRGLALAGSSRFAEAAEAHRAAGEAAERLGWVRRAAQGFMAAGEAAEDGSALPAALGYYQRALTLHELARDPAGAANALARVGGAYYASGDMLRAVEVLERARVTQESAGQHAGAARTLSNLGLAYRGLGRLDESLAAHERARAAFEGLGDRRGAAGSLIDIGNVHYARGALLPAREAFQGALRLLEQAGDEGGTATTLGNLANVAWRLGEYAEALGLHERALALQQALGRELDAARTVGNMGVVHLRRGDVAKALEAFERALAVQEARGAKVAAVRTLSWIAIARTQQGQLLEALPTLERCLRMQRDLGDAASATETLGSLGTVYLQLGDFPRALETLEAALAEHEGRGNKAGAATTLGNLGNVHFRLGNFAKALLTYERALAAKLHLGDRAGAADTLGNIGSAHTRLGDHARALATYEQALAAYEALGAKAGVALALGNIAGVHASLGHDALARQTHERALAAFEALADRAGVARTLANLGALQGRLGARAEALALFERSIAAYEALGDARGAAATRSTLGSTQHRWGEHAQASATLERALSELEALGASYDAAWTAAFLGRVNLALGRPAEARAAARRAVALRGTLFLGLGADESAIAREGISFVDEVGILACVALQDAEGLAHFLESGRSGALLEGLRARETLWAAAIAPELRAEEVAARLTEARAVAALRQALDAGDRPAAKIRRAELDTARERVAAVVARIQREAKAAAALIYPEPATLEQLRAALGEGEVLVLYALTESEAVALVVEAGGARIVSLGPTTAVEEAVEALALRNAQADPQAALDRLTSLVVQPLALPPSSARVLLSPDGVLSYVPFAPLLPGQTLGYVPSGTTYRLLREEAARRGAGVLALGDPDYTTQVDAKAVAVHRGSLGRLAPLPGTRREVEAIGDVRLLSAHATEAGLRKALAERERWRAVHLACHGLVDSEHPARSSLAITAAGDDDGFLTCLDVFRMRVPADLVVLSACETGRGRLVKGEGLLGLTRAFMFAGTPRVICSLWKVDDEATAALMKKFYELWLGVPGAAVAPSDEAKGGVEGAKGEDNPQPRLSAAEALKQAQAFVRSQEQWKHPYYWAAWVLWGLP